MLVRRIMAGHLLQVVVSIVSTPDIYLFKCKSLSHCCCATFCLWSSLQGRLSRAGQGVEGQRSGGLSAARHTALRQVRERQVLLRGGEHSSMLLVYHTHT
jgi:hypothetical protein